MTAPDSEYKMTAAQADQWSRTRLEWVDMAQLNNDGPYQRDLMPRHIMNMVRTFNPAAFAPVNVAERPDGTLWITEGKQRVETLMMLGEKRAPCFIVPVPDVPGEAKAFDLLNTNRKKPNPVEMYRAHLEARDPVAVQIAEVLVAVRVEMERPTQADPNRCAAYYKARDLVTRHGQDHLRRVMEVCGQAWEHQNTTKTYAGEVLGGISLLLRLFWPDDTSVDEVVADRLSVNDPESYIITSMPFRKVATNYRGAGPMAKAFAKALARHRDVPAFRRVSPKAVDQALLQGDVSVSP